MLDVLAEDPDVVKFLDRTVLGELLDPRHYIGLSASMVNPGACIDQPLQTVTAARRQPTRSGGLGRPHHPNELRPFPKADKNSRTVTGCWHLVHANFGACPEHRLEVLRDVTQRSNSVSPRAREYEPTAIKPPEIWPLKLSPRFFKSWK